MSRLPGISTSNFGTAQKLIDSQLPNPVTAGHEDARGVLMTTCQRAQHTCPLCDNVPARRAFIITITIIIILIIVIINIIVIIIFIIVLLLRWLGLAQVKKPSTSAEDSLAGVSAAVDSLHGVSAAVRRAKQVRWR